MEKSVFSKANFSTPENQPMGSDSGRGRVRRINRMCAYGKE